MKFSFHAVEKDLYLVKKESTVKSAGHGSDVTGPYWMLIEVTVHKGRMWYISDLNQITIDEPRFYIYVPPFSWATEYYTANTKVSIRGLISRTPLETILPEHPTVFLHSKKEFPTNMREVPSFLDGRDESKTVSICTNPSALSKRAKEILDREYNSGVEIQEIATRLKTSSAVLSRSFKKDFGHPLAFYKKGLRVTVGMYELMMGNSPTKAAELAGYNDLGRFYKQFKQYLKQTPAEYLENSEPPS